MSFDKQTADKLIRGSLMDCIAGCRSILKALEHAANKNTSFFQAQTLLEVLKTRVIHEFKLKQDDMSGIPDFEIFEIAQSGLDSYDTGADDDSKASVLELFKLDMEIALLMLENHIVKFKA
jgi:hypothetical protein